MRVLSLFGVNKKGVAVAISDTQRYKCVGNGWTREVFTFIYSFIPKM